LSKRRFRNEGRCVMAQKGKRIADQRLLLVLACGATVESAARQAGVSESTVYRRLDDHGFRRQLQALRADMVQRAAGTLTAAANEAVRALVELLKGTSTPSTRLGAARAVLELGMKVREVAELEVRLAAIEERFDAEADQSARTNSSRRR
jgi:hypothetical protein